MRLLVSAIFSCALLLLPTDIEAQTFCGNCASNMVGNPLVPGGIAVVTFYPGNKEGGTCKTMPNGQTPVPCVKNAPCEFNYVLHVSVVQGGLTGANLCTAFDQGDSACIDFPSVPGFPTQFIVTLDGGMINCGKKATMTLQIFFGGGALPAAEVVMDCSKCPE